MRGNNKRRVREFYLDTALDVDRAAAR